MPMDLDKLNALYKELDNIKVDSRVEESYIKAMEALNEFAGDVEKMEEKDYEC